MARTRVNVRAVRCASAGVAKGSEARSQQHGRARGRGRGGRRGEPPVRAPLHHQVRHRDVGQHAEGAPRKGIHVSDVALVIVCMIE